MSQGMNIDTVIEQLQRYMLDEVLFAEGVQTLDRDEDLLTSGLLDSMSAAQLGRHVEQSFGIEIEPIEFTFENFQTLEALAKLIASKLS